MSQNERNNRYKLFFQVKIIVHQIHVKMEVHVWILVQATDVIAWLVMMELTAKVNIPSDTLLSIWIDLSLLK